MKFGICTGLENAPLAKQTGWDYIEAPIQALLQGTLPDHQWTRLDAIRKSPVPILAANMLIPGALKITGPTVDADALYQYMNRVLNRADQADIRTLVFGSGAARMIPDAYPRDHAREQLMDFINMFAPLAAKRNVTVVAEPLNKGECNVLNSVAEAMTYVTEADSPGFQCLVDSYHFWLESEPLDNLRAAMPHIKHVHLADVAGRVAPGLGGTSDYKPFFRVLKDGKYTGAMSVECSHFDIAADSAKVLSFLKREWSKA